MRGITSDEGVEDTNVDNSHMELWGTNVSSGHSGVVIPPVGEATQNSEKFESTSQVLLVCLQNGKTTKTFGGARLNNVRNKIMMKTPMKIYIPASCKVP